MWHLRLYNIPNRSSGELKDMTKPNPWLDARSFINKSFTTAFETLPTFSLYRPIKWSNSVDYLLIWFPHYHHHHFFSFFGCAREWINDVRTRLSGRLNQINVSRMFSNVSESLITVNRIELSFLCVCWCHSWQSKEPGKESSSIPCSTEILS